MKIKKVCLFLIMMLSMMTCVMAADYMATISSPYTITIYPDHYLIANTYWSSTFPIQNQTITTYNQINLSTQCKQLNPDLDMYDQITNSMVGMLDVCSSAMSTINYTEGGCQRQLTNCIQSEGSFELDSKENYRLLTICNSSNNACSSDLISFRNNYSNCQERLADYKETDKNYKTCKDELEKEQDSKTSTMLVSAAVGLLIGYFMWGKKKGTGPSEQSERGNNSQDEPVFDYTEGKE